MGGNDDNLVHEFLLDLYRLQDTRTLLHTICNRLTQLIPGENVFIGRHDMRHTRIIGCSVTHPFTAPGFLEQINEFAGQHPLWEPIRSGEQIVRAMSDYATPRAWHRTGLFAELLRHDEVQDHLSVEFGARHGLLTSIGVFRSRRGFSTAEMRRMTALMPHIGRALENARIVEAAGIAGAAAVPSDDHALVQVSLDGRVSVPTPAARRNLASLADVQNGGLPPAVLGWLDHVRKRMNQGLLEADLRPFRYRARTGVLEFRLYRRDDRPGYWLGMRRIGDDTHTDATASLARLTSREREIVAWIRAGKTNEEIALILGISFFTVKAHLKSIYRKLGVQTRTEAAVLLQRADSSHIQSEPE